MVITPKKNLVAVISSHSTSMSSLWVSTLPRLDLSFVLGGSTMSAANSVERSMLIRQASNQASYIFRKGFCIGCNGFAPCAWLGDRWFTATVAGTQGSAATVV